MYPSAAIGGGSRSLGRSLRGDSQNGAALAEVPGRPTKGTDSDRYMVSRIPPSVHVERISWLDSLQLAARRGWIDVPRWIDAQIGR